jgi:glutathione S-transferase
MQAAIDSWTVGDGDNDWKEPGWEWCSDPTREAAASLIRGQRNLAAFCARGAGVTGLPVASAPLADPAATANESAIPALDLLLRYITRSLLQKKSSSTLNEATIDLLDTTSASALADCLDYLRARIGVPRDLSYPAAQEIRKELLGVSRTLRNAPPSSICSPKNLVVAEML